MSDYRNDFRAGERDYYWSVPRIFLMGAVTLPLIAATIFGLNYMGLMSFGFFQPRYEAVRRDTMLQSRAYSEATTRELYRLKLQYVQAKSDDERSTVRAFALHEAAAFDRTRLPPDLQAFLTSLGG